LFFQAFLLFLFPDDIGDESKMMRHIHHLSRCASKKKNAANDDYIVQAKDIWKKCCYLDGMLSIVN
jgi:hypothetical protein